MDKHGAAELIIAKLLFVFSIFLVIWFLNVLLEITEQQHLVGIIFLSLPWSDKK